MAYDWSGNTVKQKRDDRVVILAVAIMALVAAATPLFLAAKAPSPHLVETTSLSAVAASKLTLTP